MDRKPSKSKHVTIKSSSVSQSTSKSLSVSRKANVTCKPSTSSESRTLRNGNRKSSNISTQNASSSVIVPSSEKDIHEIAEDMRKVKSVIVKHENRIRVLEAQLRAVNDDETDPKLA